MTKVLGGIRCEQLGPHSTILARSGFALECLDRKPEAIVAYRESLDDNPNEDEALLGLARLLVKGEMHELAARLQATYKPELHFISCFYAAERVKDDDAKEAILAVFRKRCPDHAWGPVQSARIGFGKSEPARAEAELKTALAAKNHEQVDSLVRLFVQNQAGVKAYTLTPRSERGRVFRIAVLLLLDEDFYLEGQFEDDDDGKKHRAAVKRLLTDLIESRSKDDADDLWIHYARGCESAEMMLWPAAEISFTKALEGLKPDDSDFSMVRSRIVEAMQQQRKSVEALQRFGRAKEVFAQLAQAALNEKSSATLALLLNEYSDPKDADLPYWRGTQLFLAKDYVNAARELRGYLSRTKEKDEYGRDWHARDEYVRSLVRDGRTAEAQRFLETIPANELNYSTLPVLVLAAGGNAPGAQAELEKKMADSPWVLSFCYRDDDLGPLLFAPAYDDFRKQHPEPAPWPRTKR